VMKGAVSNMALVSLYQHPAFQLHYPPIHPTHPPTHRANPIRYAPTYLHPIHPPYTQFTRSLTTGAGDPLHLVLREVPCWRTPTLNPPSRLPRIRLTRCLCGEKKKKNDSPTNPLTHPSIHPSTHPPIHPPCKKRLNSYNHLQ
jgi:hypothetical protein